MLPASLLINWLTAIENRPRSSATIASAGRAIAAQQVSSKKVGEVSVSYTTGSALSAGVSTGLADLPETAYGLQLLTLARMYSRSVYVP